jgi:toxin ParE1/3/4
LATIFSIPAKRDLLEIWVYIAEDNMDAADATERRIRGLCDKLATSPGMGKPRLDLGTDIRMFGVGNYMIYYRPSNNGVEILRVAHGSRDALRLFRLR